MIFSSPLYAAGGDVVWQYGDGMNNKQQAVAMAVDSEGSTYIAGFTEEFGTQDFHTVKVKADGSGVDWRKTFNMAGGNDQLTAIAIDSEDNVIVTGFAMNGTNNDFHTIKYSGTDGSVLWEHTYNAPDDGHDYPNSVAVDSLNNVYVGGNSQGSNGADDFMIVKYGPNGPNPDGTPIWTQSYDGAANGHDRIVSIAAGPDGIAVTGQSQNSNPDFEMLTIKYGFDSTKLWEKSKSASGDERGISVAVDTEGNVIVSGLLWNGSNKDIYTVKYSSAGGAVLWEDTLDNGYDEEPDEIIVDSFGDVYITGYTFQISSAEDIYTIKYDGSSGLMVWSSKFNSVNGDNDYGTSIVVDESGDLFVTGYSHEDVEIHDNFQTLKYSKSDGNLLWNKDYKGPAGKDERAVGAGLTASGEVIVAGWSDVWTSGASDYDYYSIKYDPGLLNPPTNLFATTQTTSHIELNWSDNASNEDGFKIERKIGEFGTYTEIGTVLANVTSYNDMGLNADTRYYYRVRSFNASDGDSYYSNETYAVTTLFTFTAPVDIFTYNGPDSGDDFISSIAAGPDYNPVVTGYSFSIFGQFDYYTVKMSRTGLSETWSHRYDSDQNNMDMASTIAVDDNNDVIVSGYSNLYSIESGNNTNDVFTIKYPASGPPETWSDQYNGPSGDDDRSVAVGMARDSSNNIVVIGYGKNALWNDDIYVIKYLPDGSIDWTMTPYDGGGDDYPSGVYFDPAGDVVVTGYTHNGTDNDYFTRKLDGSSGTPLWTDIYDVDGSGDDEALSVTVDSQGYSYVTGTAYSSSGNKDFYTIKYDGINGSRVWEKTYNGPADGDDEAAGIILDPVNDDILVAGTALADSGNKEIHVVRYNTGGIVVWERTLERPGTSENAVDLAIDLSGNIHVAGTTGTLSSSDIISVQFTYDGGFAGGIIYDGASSGQDEAAGVAVNILGEAFVGGFETGSGGDADYVVFKISNSFLQSPTPFLANVNPTRADLSWSDNSLNEDGYHLERKTGACSLSGTWTPLATLSLGTITFQDDTLSNNETYCYRVRTYNDLGDISRWVEREVTTEDAVAPSGLIATTVNTTRIDLSWTDNTNTEDGFIIERCTGAGCTNFLQIADLAPDSVSYQDTNVCQSGSYSYRVKSYRSLRWTTGYSNVATAISGTMPLSSTFNIEVERLSEAEIGITWDDTAVDEAGFTIERCTGDAAACTLDTDFTEVVSGNSFNSGPVVYLEMEESSWNGTLGEVADSSGNELNGTSYNGASTAPGGVFGMAGNFDGANDYVNLGNPSGLQTGASQTIEMWLKPNSFASRTNPYEKAYGGEGSISVETDGTVNYYFGTCYGDCAPYQSFTMTDPLQLNVWTHIAVVRDLTNMKLRWYKDGVLTDEAEAVLNPTTSSKNVIVGKGYAGYFNGMIDDLAVFSRGLSVTEIRGHYNNGVSVNSRSYVDSGLNPSQTYTYRIKAYKDAFCSWDSLYSPTVSAVTTLNDPDNLQATVVDTTLVNLTWADNTSTESQFTIERCNGSGCDFTTVDMTDTTTADINYYSDLTVCEGTDYTYRVMAERGSSPVWQSGWSSPPASVNTPSISLLAPSGLTAVAISESEVDLQWTGQTSDETGFRVERCAGAGCSDYVEIATKDKTPGALLLLAMDEPSWTGAADEVVDTSGNNNHGTAYGGVTTVTEGYYGNAGSFNGSSNFVETPLYIDQTSGTSGATMEAWVYPTSTSSGRHEVISTDNGGYDWSLLRNGSNWTVFTGSGEFVTGFTVDLNQWQHIAAVFDPASGVKFYKNGYEISSTGTINYDTDVVGITVGRRSLGNEYFAGRIDEVAVYDRPLNASEIAEHYELGIQANSTKRYRDSGLNPGVVYQYRVAAYKSSACPWNTSFSPSASATTNNVPEPTALVITTVDSATLKLDWTDNTTSETSFTIERCDGAGCDFSIVDASFSVSADVTTYSDNTLCEASAYGYRVRAEKDDGPVWLSNWSISAEGTTDSKAAPENILATIVDETTIEIDWTDNVNDETGFRVLRCMGAGCTPDQPLADLETTNAEMMVLHMDETSWVGSNAVQDSSGNGFHATAYSGADSAEYGKFGRAGAFNGTTGYAYANLNIDQSSTSPGATMEAWVKPSTDTGGWRHVISTDDDGVEWSLAQYNNTWWVLTGASSWNSGLTVDVDQWQHVVAVFTPGTGVTVYKNGVSVSTATIGYNTDDRNIILGRRARSGQYYYSGLMDEVAIYNRPLTNAEIQQLYIHGAQSLASKRYTDTSLQTNQTYRYRVWAYKDGACPWESDFLEIEPNTTPPPPENLLAASVNSTQIDLSWSDRTAAETGFRIERCTGNACADFAEISTVPTDARSYSDLTVCESAEYSYRVKAYLATDWETVYSNESSAVTVSKAAPTGLSAQRISEIQIDLAWTDNNSDETGFKLERCSGAGCSNFTEIQDLPADTVTYKDSGIVSGLSYSYRILSYKTADCAWTTAYSTEASADATVMDPSLLSAAAVNTTQVDLSWTDTTASETVFEIERCEGAGCNNYALLDITGPDQYTYSDTSACNSTSYSYRVRARNEGLSNHGGGCWTRRAPLLITDFASNYETTVNINYDSDMNADFSDVRFFDETGGIELPYFVVDKTDGVSATFILRTLSNNNIYMYYGNPSAAGSDDIDRLYEYYDSFPGTLIDTSRWIEIDPNNAIEQNDGLILNDVSDAWDKALISQQTFSRAADRTFYMKVNIEPDTMGNNYFMAGWELDQITNASYNQLVHGFYFNNYLLTTYEKGSHTGPNNQSYAAATEYEIMIVLKTAGAKYYVRGGIYSSWTLVKETGTHSDATMRLAITQYSKQATIREIKVMASPLFNTAGDPVVTAGAEEQDSCYSFAVTWSTGYSNEANATTMTPAAPSGFLTTAVTDTQADLTWTDNTMDETGFRVERCEGQGCSDFTEISVTSGNAVMFSDAGLTPETDYCYRIRSTKNAVCGWDTAYTSVSCDLTFSTSPTTLNATAANSMVISLGWSDNANDEEGYEVEEKVWNGRYVKIATLGANATSYIDKRGVEAGKEYTYRVRAFRAADFTPYSNEAAVTTPVWQESDDTCY